MASATLGLAAVVTGMKGYSLDRIHGTLAAHLHVEKRWLFSYNRAQVFFPCRVD